MSPKALSQLNQHLKLSTIFMGNIMIK